MKVELYLSLGSNMGDRAKNISDAVSCLNIALGHRYKSLSSVIETEPWGFESETRFLNAAVMYELELKSGYNAEAEGLVILEKCKEIEKMLGREQKVCYDGKGERVYFPRPIDIDILFLGDSRIDCPELTVPHRLMKERDFVMIPLNEIASDHVRNTFKEQFEKDDRDV